MPKHPIFLISIGLLGGILFLGGILGLALFSDKDKRAMYGLANKDFKPDLCDFIKNRVSDYLALMYPSSLIVMSILG